MLVLTWKVFVESASHGPEFVFIKLEIEKVHYITHTHPFNGPLSRTTRVSRYQKDKTNLDFTEA